MTEKQLKFANDLRKIVIRETLEAIENERIIKN